MAWCEVTNDRDDRCIYGRNHTGPHMNRFGAAWGGTPFPKTWMWSSPDSQMRFVVIMHANAIIASGKLRQLLSNIQECEGLHALNEP